MTRADSNYFEETTRALRKSYGADFTLRLRKGVEGCRPSSNPCN